MRAETPHSFERDPGELSAGKAFFISLLVHVLLFGIGHNMPVKPPQQADKKNRAKPDEVKTVTIEFELQDTRPAPQPKDTPLEFVWVDPSNTAAEPPKDTKRYSFANSVAANPSPQLDTGQAKIDGLQDKVLQSYDEPRVKPMPLQPLLSKPQAEPEQPREQTKELAAAPSRPKAQPKAEPSPKLAGKESPEGNTLSKPKLTAPPPSPKTTETAKSEARKPEQTEPKRPRTIAEARQQMASRPAGMMTKQDGGVTRQAKVSIDAKGSEFGEYDARLIGAITSRWKLLIDDTPEAPARIGLVVIQFRLHADGRVSMVQQAQSTVGFSLGWICQRAVTDPAPFEKWPDSMRLTAGQDYRDVKFTFHYN